MNASITTKPTAKGKKTLHSLIVDGVVLDTRESTSTYGATVALVETEASLLWDARNEDNAAAYAESKATEYQVDLDAGRCKYPQEAPRWIASRKAEAIAHRQKAEAIRASIAQNVGKVLATGLWSRDAATIEKNARTKCLRQRGFEVVVVVTA